MLLVFLAGPIFCALTAAVLAGVQKASSTRWLRRRLPSQNPIFAKLWFAALLAEGPIDDNADLLFWTYPGRTALMHMLHEWAALPPLEVLQFSFELDKVGESNQRLALVHDDDIVPNYWELWIEAVGLVARCSDTTLIRPVLLRPLIQTVQFVLYQAAAKSTARRLGWSKQLLKAMNDHWDEYFSLRVSPSNFEFDSPETCLARFHPCLDEDSYLATYLGDEWIPAGEQR